MAVFIARDGTLGIHYFVRVSDSLAEADAWSVNAVDHINNLATVKNVKGNPMFPSMFDFINKLTTAKSHKQLATALDNAPLLLGENRGPYQLDRVMRVEELLPLIDGEDRCIVPVDAKGLAREMFLASPKPLRANRGYSSPAASLDVMRGNNAASLKSMSAGMPVFIEPVADWMTFRNTLAIGAALLANIENPPEDGRVLDVCGFELQSSAGRDEDEPVFSIPFKCSLLPPSLGGRGEPEVKLDRDLDYMYSLYGDAFHFFIAPLGLGISDDGMVFVAGEQAGTRTDYLVEDAYLRRYCASCHELKPIDRYRVVWRLHLCAKQHASQLDTAKEIVIALWRLNQNLKNADGTLLGRAEAYESLFNAEAKSMAYDHRSLVSMAWEALCFHGGRRLTACRHCGCGSFDPVRGRPREYCSASCGMQDRGTA